MTICTAIYDPERGETWLGSDSQTSVNHLPYFNSRKWMIRNGWAVGRAGLHRVQNLMDHHAPKLFDDLDGHYDLAQRIRKLLSDDGFAPGDDHAGCAPGYEAEFLIVRPGQVWLVCGDFSILALPPGTMGAIGSGTAFALGAAHAVKKLVSDAGNALLMRTAIEASVLNDNLCGGAPYIKQLEVGNGTP